ncbi:hypothetical protein [Nonomuraea sp. NPDC048916]|uniref:hypothetical protein n=1 Tax=Nonomuraea sp. NPDC048916 TaxID=3154232 RepID=UPI0033C9AFE8
MTSSDTLHRVENACAQLRRDGQPVTFTSIAHLTGLGRTTLYRSVSLRALIEEHRHRAATNGSLTGLLEEIRTLHTALEAVAARVRQHEEQIRRLTNRVS